MSPLNSAIALIHVHVIAMLVTENLDLNVTGVFDILLNNHMIIIKSFHGFSFGSVELVHKFSLITNNPHTFATSAERGLQHDREPDFAGLREKILR